jgi:hypothetical protein
MNTVTVYTGPLRGIPAPRHGLIARMWLRIAWRR